MYLYEDNNLFKNNPLYKNIKENLFLSLLSRMETQEISHCVSTSRWAFVSLNNIEELLQCPVCYDFMQCPIYQVFFFFVLFFC